VITPAQAVINHAAELGHCSHIRIKRFKVAKTIRKAVDRIYIDKFRAAASAQLGSLMLFMMQTGCRISAAVNLTWDDVNLAERIVTVGKDKNGDPHRLYLTLEMLALLANLPKDRRKVFGYASRHAVYNGIKGACIRAGIAYLGTHQPGRHSFATELLVRKGVDVATVAKLGNWRSPRVLLENYAHPENEREVIERAFGTPAAHKKQRALR
jgi:integrase